MNERRVLFACDLDSQVFGALPIARTFTARGWSATFAVESVRSLPRSMLPTLETGFSLIERPVNALATDEEAFRYDAIGVYVTGSRLALFRHTLELAADVKKRKRPILFCGFNGLVFEKFEEGLAWRLGYDVVGLNSPRDRDAFVDFLQGSEYAKQPSVIVGLRRKTDAPPRPLKALAGETGQERAPVGGGAPPAEETAEDGPADIEDAVISDPAADDVEDATISDVGPASFERSVVSNAAAPPEDAGPPRKLFVFAEQVVVPRAPKQREALVATLARLAVASPGWTVALKARVRRDEQTFHAQTGHIESLVEALPERPANLEVTYEPLEDLLERADLFATISSTALFDAFDYGVPSLVATDFGLRNADGAHVFFSSGLLIRLCDLGSLDEAPRREPDERWLRRMGYGGSYSPAALVDWVESFDPSRPLPKAFVSFEGAAQVAAGVPQNANGVLAAWYKTQLAANGDASVRSSPQASLIMLGSTMTKMLAIARRSGGRKENVVATSARSVGVYWFYKRTLERLGFPQS